MKYHENRILQACEERDTIVLLKKRTCTSVGEYCILRVLRCSKVDLFRVLLALSRSSKVNFDAEGGLAWFAINFDDCVVSKVTTYGGSNRGGSVTQAEISVSY